MKFHRKSSNHRKITSRIDGKLYVRIRKPEQAFAFCNLTNVLFLLVPNVILHEKIDIIPKQLYEIDGRVYMCTQNYNRHLKCVT